MKLQGYILSLPMFQKLHQSLVFSERRVTMAVQWRSRSNRGQSSFWVSMPFIWTVSYFDTTGVEIYLTRNLQPVIGLIHMSLSHPGSWRETRSITLGLSWRLHLVCARVLAVGSWLEVAVISGCFWFFMQFRRSGAHNRGRVDRPSVQSDYFKGSSVRPRNPRGDKSASITSSQGS